jgi:hypothetical protein
MSMLMRIVLVTLGLAVAGLVAGAAVGVVMMACWMAPVGLRELMRNPSMLVYGGVFGGMVGAVLGPAGAWLLMRTVPLGLAVGGTALGTILGAVAGLVTAGFAGSFYGAFLGFGAAAVLLRVRSSRRRALASPADAPAIARAPQGV